ncbi:ENTH-domain-containing protein [Lactarius psammicola]|nr:ENTH-domain-containing protein [Lactarius psammicola]KAI9452003.1 ENTH-domain-containing protein [Lactarius psammicola]
MVLKGALRVVKNVTNGYSDAEAKVRSATNSENVIPSGAQMHELAQMSYNHEDFVDIVSMLDKRLNDKGKYWRHVYKSLVVVEYLLHSGSPKVAQYFRDNIYIIKTLTEFQHTDDSGRDVGQDVRVRARELSRLLADDKSLAETRSRRKQMHDRMAGRRVGENANEEKQRPVPPRKQPSQEEQDIQRALKLSEQEEAERRRRLKEQGKDSSLFDDPKAAPSNLIDLTVDESQPWQLQPQFTSIPPQMTMVSSVYDPSAVQAQFTAFDPYAQQAQYEAMLQAEYARQQAEAAQQQQQYYALQMQATQFQPLVPQKTAVYGSNNPFAQSPSPVPTPGPTYAYSSPPSASATPALVHGYPRPPSSASVSSHASSLPPRTPISARADALAAVLGTSTGPGGIDTFGNVGSLRYGSSALGSAAQQRTGAVF